MENKIKLFRRTTIGMSLLETLDHMVSNGALSSQIAFQVLVQFDESMTEAVESQVKSDNVKFKTLDDIVSEGKLNPDIAIQAFVHFNKATIQPPQPKGKSKISIKSTTRAPKTKEKSKISIKGSVHTNRSYFNIRTFILEKAVLKTNKTHQNIGRIMILVHQTSPCQKLKRFTIGEHVKFCL